MMRKLLTSGTVVVILGGAVAGGVLVWRSSTKQPAANRALPSATALNIEGNSSKCW